MQILAGLVLIQLSETAVQAHGVLTSYRNASHRAKCASEARLTSHKGKLSHADLLQRVDGVQADGDKGVAGLDAKPSALIRHCLDDTYHVSDGRSHPYKLRLGTVTMQSDQLQLPKSEAPWCTRLGWPASSHQSSAVSQLYAETQIALLSTLLCLFSQCKKSTTVCVRWS